MWDRVSLSLASQAEFKCVLVSTCLLIMQVRERPLDSQGGAWVFFEKNILALVLAKKNILALTMCEKNILAPSIEKKMSALYPWKENVCPLSMKRKCLPSIYMKIKCWPSNGLYKWYYHGSRTNLIFVSLSWSWWRNVGSKLERHWTVIKLLGHIIFHL